MTKRAGGSKAKAKHRKAPAAKTPRPASGGVARLRPIKNARRHEIGGVKIEAVSAANGQVKRVVYPPGFRWSTHMKPVVGTELCMHGHVGFLSTGRVRANSTATAAPWSSSPRRSSCSSRSRCLGRGVASRRSSSSSTLRGRRRSASGFRPSIGTERYRR